MRNSITRKRTLGWALLASAVMGCSSGIDTTTSLPPAPASTSEIGLGFDPGVTLSQPIESAMAVAGAEIATPAGGVPRQLIFLAFATASAADDPAGDGSGALVRDASPQSDTNGQRDVFIAAIENTDVDLGDGLGPRPAAFSQALVNVFRHDRCTNCHAAANPSPDGLPPVFPGFPEGSHPGGDIVSCGCTTCHGGDSVPDLEGTVWRAPFAADSLTPSLGFDFRNKTVEELNMMAQGEDQAACMGTPTGEVQATDPVEHLKHDTRIIWAINSGNVPFEPPVVGGSAGTSDIWAGAVTEVDRGAVPITQAEWNALVDAWAAGGFQATNASAVRDLALVSRVGGNAGDGDSFAPDLTYVPNPAFNPEAPQAAPAGFLHVAFVTTSTDLVAGASMAGAQVVHTTLEVWADRDPVTSATLAGGVDLMFTDATQLVSASAASATSGANDDSSAPRISADGMRIAFASLATDLVTGFAEGNASSETDVYLRDISGGLTHLASASIAGATTGGSGASEEPSIAPDGDGVAFSSTASDLVSDDTNGVRDVFGARFDGTEFAPATRASANSTAESDAPSRSPSVFSPASDGGLRIAFESDATTLFTGASGTQIYLYDDVLGTTSPVSRVTEALSTTKGSASGFGNGASRRPRFSPGGNALLFDTLADNLDTRRMVDANGAEDLMLVSLAPFFATGEIQPRRLSVAFNGGDADGASTSALVASFRSADPSAAESLFVSYATDATNLGASPASGNVIVFVEDSVLPPVANFSSKTLVGRAPLEVNFINQSTGSFDSFAWDFGDPESADNTSELSDPTHVYTAIGSYTVTLTATGEGGESVSQKLDYITVAEDVIADFSVDFTSRLIGEPVAFTDLSTGNPVEWSWDFGDGNTSTDQNPTHSYATSNTYDVVLSATGLVNNDSETKTDLITVFEPGAASFTADIQSGDAPLTVQFTDMSSGDVNSWSWNFDDGTTSNEQNPMHTFNTPGDYSISLTVDGPIEGTADQDTFTRPDFISVTAPPTAADVVAIFADPAKCSNCHNNSNAAGGLNFELPTSTIRSALLERSQCDTNLFRVVPGDLDASLTFDKILAASLSTPPECGLPMPVSDTLSGPDIDIVRRWILAGAPE